MSRAAPKTQVPFVIKDEKAGLVKEIRKYSVITPLYGGGEEPQEADSLTLVRATEVRGNLRFWWRATRGGKYDNRKALSDAESKIWGSASADGQKDGGPSKINVLVSVTTAARANIKDDKPFEVVGNRRIQPRKNSIVPPYIAFPLQPKKEDAVVGMDTRAVKVGVEFSLEISYPNEEDFKKEVQAALWAWETFGGIGGRTRRGFGALKLEEWWINGTKKPIVLPAASQVCEELYKNLKEHVLEGNWMNSLSHLAHNLRMEPYQKSSKPEPVWKALITRYQAFRQLSARVDRKTGNKSNFGLSLWPEANVLRTRLNRTPRWPDTTNQPTLVDKFPRAEFGLPILFHLPHDNNQTYTLQGDKIDPKSDKSYERLASRLILKPLACANNEYVGLAAVLVGPSEPPTGLQIKELLSVAKPVTGKLDNTEANSAPLSQILHGQTNVIEAFLRTLK